MTTILLVDATEADAAILASALRVEGYEVVVARSASEARAALAARPCGLAILDLMLRRDGGHGLELARELRREHPGMRVLLTSSYHLSERQLARADCGVSGFIPKPYDLEEVVAFVHAKVAGPPSSRQVWREEPASGVTSRVPPLDDARDGTSARG
jgi:DNA-binding response OmpR family regulator